MIPRFLLLNGIAILGVILFHSAGWGFVAMFSWAERYADLAAYNPVGSLSYYLLRFMEQLVVFSIPAFLFVSGFFIAFATGRKQKTISWKVVRIRIRDLLIPYLLWSFLLIFLQLLEGKTTTPAGLIVILLTGQANPAYYYIPLMIQFYLLSPFLVRWAKASPISMLIITAVIQLYGVLQTYPTMLGLETTAVDSYVDIIPKWLFIARIFWFSLGIISGFHIKYLQIHLLRYRKALLATSLILIPLGMIEWEIIQNNSGQFWLPHRETVIDSIYSLTVVFAFLGFYQSKLPYTNVVNDLGSKSFGIYLVHSPVMEYTARFIAILFPWLLAYQIILQPILIVAGLGVPLILMALMVRSPARRNYKYVFG